MNHPPITEITPVRRNTALSRPHALSARDVPIATMKVTNVVERGNFIDVPSAMSIPAIIRLTDPRTRSKAAPSSGCAKLESRRFPIHSLIFFGVRDCIHENMFKDARTRERPMRDEPNNSSPWAWELRPTVVCVTWRAFFDVARATTITMPAPIKK